MIHRDNYINYEGMALLDEKHENLRITRESTRAAGKGAKSLDHSYDLIIYLKTLGMWNGALKCV